MRNLSLSVVLSLSITAVLLSSCGPTPQHSSGQLDLQQYRGRWLVVNYWAEWCVPCRKEIPELNQLAQQLANQVSVLGVNYDGLAGAELAASVATMGIEFATTGEDPAAELQLTRPMVLPTTYVLDPQGNLVHTLIGPQSYQQLAQLVGASTAKSSP